jgi:hypothetical protein
MKAFPTLSSLTSELPHVAGTHQPQALTPVPLSVLLLFLALLVSTTYAAIDEDLFKKRDESILVKRFAECPSGGPFTMWKYFTPMISRQAGLWYLRDHQNIRGMNFVIQIKDQAGAKEDAPRLYMTVGSVPSVSSTPVKKQGTAVFHMTLHNNDGTQPVDFEFEWNQLTTCSFKLRDRKQTFTDVKVFWKV